MEELVPMGPQPVEKNIEDHYIVEHTIGSGTFGDVLKARLARDPRQVVALKQLRNPQHEPLSVNNLRETIFFKHVTGHPNIVTLYEMFRDPTTATMVFVLELMHGTLLTFMEYACRSTRGPFSVFLVGGIIKDVLKGLEHIHASGFVHRDLKPENILFTTDARGHMAVKIADFGLCRPIEEPGSTTTRWTSYVATRWYRAPEQILGITHHTPGLDIWAMSLILYELCNQTPMFPGRTTVEMTALQVQALKFPSADSIAGPCPAVAHRLAMMNEWEDVFDQSHHQRWTSFIRWSEHSIFLSPLVSGLQWEAAARPTASQYLLKIRRLLQMEWKRQGRLERGSQSPRRHGAQREPRSTTHHRISLPRFHKRRPPTS